jgi:hypothetical protein
MKAILISIQTETIAQSRLRGRKLGEQACRTVEFAFAAAI